MRVHVRATHEDFYLIDVVTGVVVVLVEYARFEFVEKKIEQSEPLVVRRGALEVTLVYPAEQVGYGASVALEPHAHVVRGQIEFARHVVSRLPREHYPVVAERIVLVRFVAYFLNGRHDEQIARFHRYFAAAIVSLTLSAVNIMQRNVIPALVPRDLHGLEGRTLLFTALDYHRARKVV